MIDLSFQFESFSEFMLMAGHGPYVWACYLITATALIYLACAPLLKRRALFAELKRQARIENHELKKRKQNITEDSQ